MKFPVFAPALVLIFTLYYAEALGKITQHPPGGNFNTVYQQARKSLDKRQIDQAISLAGTPLEKGKAHHLAGYTLKRSGQMTPAAEHFYQAILAYGDAGEQKLQADVRESLAVILYHLYNYRNSIVYLQKTLHARESLGDPKVSNTHFNLGLAYHKLYAYDSAVFYLLQAADGFKKHAKKAAQARALHELAYVQHHLEAYSEAQRYYIKVLDIAMELSDTTRVSKTLNDLGYSYLEQGELVPAQAYLEKALAWKQHVVDTELLISTYNNLGELQLLQGDTTAAMHYYEQAAAQWQPDSPNPNALEAVKHLQDYYTARGEIEKVAPYYQRMTDMSLKLLQQNEDMQRMKMFYEGQMALRRMEQRERDEKWRQQLYQYLVSGAIVVCLTALLAIVYFRRAKKRKQGLKEIAKIIG